VAAQEAKRAATPTHIYKGVAPGVEGLTRAVRKAHEAVGTSQRNAAALEAKSERASDEGASAAPASAASTAARHSATATHAAQAAPSRSSSSKSSSAAADKQAQARTVATTQAVEHELRAGATVLILFWNPKGSGDRAVRREVAAVKGKMGHRVAVHYARANEVGTFGTITRSIPVYQTPTVLVVAGNKRVTTLTGLPDAYGIEQAISEAKH
jgi:hypothetical protein